MHNRLFAQHAHLPALHVPLQWHLSIPCPPTAESPTTAALSPIVGMSRQCSRVKVNPSWRAVACWMGTRQVRAYKDLSCPVGHAKRYCTSMSCTLKRTTSTTTTTTDVGSVFPRSTSATPNRTGSPTSSTIFPCTLVTRSFMRLAWLASLSKAASRFRRRFGDECLSGAASASVPVFERA